MAYNAYFPQFYQPTNQVIPNFMYPTNQNSQNGIIWVQGETTAKSYPVEPSKSVLLMDSENPVFYIKSTDQSGMPLPLRIFDYKERVQNNSDKVDNSSNEKKETQMDYVSRSEFEKFKDDIKEAMRQRPSNNYKKPNKED